MTTPGPYDAYSSPLSGRYASKQMQQVWSPRHKFQTWRRIWLAVAEAQHELGLPVTAEQVEELRANLDVTDEDMAAAERYEAELRHDVMAHVHAWGDRCPKAKGIIHLGMTSQDINDNCELLLLHESLNLIERRLRRLTLGLGEFAEQWKTTPTLGFTHYQPAQPVTIGRRAVQWAHDVEVGAFRVANTRDRFLRLRGMRGATGTQASYLALLESEERVEQIEAKFIEKLAPSEPMACAYGMVTQTYARSIDALVVADLGAAASVLHKVATDIRLLSNRKELDEPFGDKQVGSSAMPYKRNPMMCERICGLSRFVWNLVGNAYDTAATQWLERTLDDSANRRLVLPEAFLALDGALVLMERVVKGLEVHEATVRKNLMAELPFMASENLLMEAVKAGADRQAYHEKIRVHAQAAGSRVKNEGADNDLIERLKADPDFHPPALQRELDWDGVLDPMKYVGLSVEQTERFLREVIEPLREQFAGESAEEADAPRV